MKRISFSPELIWKSSNSEIFKVFWLSAVNCFSIDWDSAVSCFAEDWNILNFLFSIDIA